MNNKILFMILGEEIKFLPQDSTMDHREWFLSLGGTMEEYENIIRGYIIDNYVIFFKANLGYDSEVIDVATVCGPVIKQQLNRPELKVCCGIEPGHDGTKWEPIVMLKGYGLDGVSEKTKKSRLDEQVIEKEEIEEKKDEMQRLEDDLPPEPLIEFNNDFTSPEFIKYATKFNIIILVVAVITKIFLFATKKIMSGDSWSTLLIIAQIALLVLSTIGYNKKDHKAKYFSLGAAIALFFMFDLVDIILGILVVFFTIDQKYIVKLMSFINKYKNIILEKLQKLKKKNTVNSASNSIPNNNQIPNTQIGEINNTTPMPIPNINNDNNNNNTMM